MTSHKIESHACSVFVSQACSVTHVCVDPRKDNQQKVKDADMEWALLSHDVTTTNSVKFSGALNQRSQVKFWMTSVFVFALFCFSTVIHVVW